MVRTPGWGVVSASAYLLALSLFVLTFDSVPLSGPLALVVVAGSVGLVAFLGRLHPRPAVALADRRLHAVLAAVPLVIFLVSVYVPGVAFVSPVDPLTWILLCWSMAGVALYASVTNAQARHYEEQSERVVHLRVRPTARTRRRRAALFGVLGVVLIVGVWLVSVPSVSRSFVMGLGFSALFSGVLGARRPRTYRLVDGGLIRQDGGARVGMIRLPLADRDGRTRR
ncbi:hypothetical protein HAPAU_18710 [Halalkalicoccus paucihalophilus]|uniref:Uncharacterized protein n=1 Tax=Halalkalicoccus paucihalophilus TaxID=1008153 RepID=A0A151AGN6_9EURY|nr:hypothetical protein [Halalkalicoccus paucihalophilus]KYH26765.1 hypothetical protein HAPAU_18710 [Halalkalicoccus paucihalophilus]